MEARPLTGPAPPGLPDVDADAEDGSARIEAELHAELTSHLAAGRPTADVGQIGVAVFTVVAFWTVMPAWVCLAWCGLLASTAALRGINRRGIAGMDTGERRELVRRDVWFSGVLWGAWSILIIGTDLVHLAFMMVITAGLVAAATSTLVADKAAFRGFLALLVVPLIVAIPASGLGRDHLVLLAVTCLYGPFMLGVHGRTHRILVDQIRSAARLRMTEEETARRRDFLNALVTSAPSPIVVTDHEGHVVRANPAFQRVLGYDWSAVEGEPLADLVAIGDNRGPLRDFFRSVASGTREVAEFRLSHRNGHPVWIRVSGTAASGMAEGMVILVGEDVTAQVAARETQERARTEAEEGARAKSAFLASMSHEIRTPLNGILGMVEVLMDTGLDERQREAAEIVRSSGQVLLRILNDVLDVSKIEAGQLDLESIDFEVSETVGEAVRVFSVAAASRGIELLLDIAPDTPVWAHGDPIRIRQVLTNLISNAVKFTDEGEIVVSVRDAREEGGAAALRFTVRDTGVGIPTDKQQIIFQEFEQADRSTTRTHGGTGLGLTISKRLVELMGGTLTVHSVPRRGSEFAFTLPLEAAAERVSVRRPTDVHMEGRSFLIVDDNATSRRILREALALAEASEVVEAPTVDDALAAVASRADDEAFDAILLDHMMPGKDGFEFSRAVKEMSPGSPPRILMLTSAGDAIASDQARGAGIGGYLAKPVGRKDLYRALRQLLGYQRDDGPERRLVTRETLARDRGDVRILLAEDNAVNQQVAVALLTKRGYRVVAVGDGVQAVDAVKRETFDMILMDIQMPEMDGLEATRAIRRLPGFADLPIAALTAHAFAEERDRCHAAGMNDFLAKPFKPEDLFALVDRWTIDRYKRGGRGSTLLEKDIMDEDAGPPVDLEGFRSIMRDAGVEEVVDTTVEIYVEEAPEIFDALRAAAESGRLAEVRAQAHSLKSSSGNIRATGLADHMRRLERAATDGDGPRVAESMAAATREFEAVMAYLRKVSSP